MNTKIKMVVADIDGTLVDHADMSDFTRTTINELHEKGYKFAIASGRPEFQLRRLSQKWNLNFTPDVIIGMNGAEIYNVDTDEFEKISSLSFDTMKYCIDFMKPFYDDINLFVYVGSGVLFQKDDDLSDDYRFRYGGEEAVTIAKSEDEFYKIPQAKLLYRLRDASKMKEIEEYVNLHKRDDFVGFKTQDKLYELTNPNTNKGNAVIHYASKHGLSLDEIAGFGDMTNDLEMIQVCGMGVCLLNGSDDCKAAADYITEEDCAHNGFANFVHKYIFEDDIRG